MRIIIRWPLRGPSGQRRAAGQRAPFRRRRSALRADSLRCSVCGHVRSCQTLANIKTARFLPQAGQVSRPWLWHADPRETPPNVAWRSFVKYHLFTAALLLAALVLYSVGLRSGGMVVFVVGAACELWFWLRVIRGGRDARPTASSMERWTFATSASAVTCEYVAQPFHGADVLQQTVPASDRRSWQPLGAAATILSIRDLEAQSSKW